MRGSRDFTAATYPLPSAGNGATGPTGPTGPGSATIANRVPFDLTSPSPFVITTLVPGALLTRVSILITTPYDQPTALRVGTFANPGLYFDIDAATLAATTCFDDVQLFLITVPDSLVLTWSSSGATQGAGILYYTYRLG